jgi:DHA1 family bicyclomycin/chloramphenicol resistance-like MFS transporter
VTATPDRPEPAGPASLAGRPAAVARVPVRVVVLLGALAAFAPLSTDLYLPALPRVTGDLHASASAVQASLTTCLVGLAVGQLLAGPVSDVLGRRRPLLVGLAGYAVTSLLCAVAPDVWTLCGLRFLQGLAGAAGVVISRAVVRDLRSGAAAARLFALLMLVNGAAPALAPSAGALLLRLTSWRGLFVLLALVGVVLLVAVPLGLPETLPPERRHAGGLRATGAAFRTLATDRLFAGYALVGGLVFAAMFTYIASASFVVQDVFGLSAQVFGVVFGVNAVGLVAAGQVSGLLVGRLGPERLLRAGLGLAAVGGAAVLVTTLAGAGPAGLLPALFVLVTAVGLVSPNATALALAEHGSIAGSASAVLGSSMFVLGAAVAPVAGAAGPNTAVPMALTIAALLALAAAIYLLVVRPARRRTAP